LRLQQLTISAVIKTKKKPVSINMSTGTGSSLGANVEGAGVEGAEETAEITGEKLTEESKDELKKSSITAKMFENS
jgi:hypothetical protein